MTITYTFNGCCCHGLDLLPLCADCVKECLRECQSGHKETSLCRPTQELRGLGVANLFGAAFNCYTTTGSFSRSAIMDASGAKSQVAGITSAIVVMFVLLFLTPVFKNMPQNVQGAIVIAAVIGLFNYSEWFFLWKVSPLRCARCAVHAVLCMLRSACYALHTLLCMLRCAVYALQAMLCCFSRWCLASLRLCCQNLDS